MQWTQRIRWFQTNIVIYFNKHKINIKLFSAFIIHTQTYQTWSGIWCIFWVENKKKIYMKKRMLYLMQAKTAPTSISTPCGPVEVDSLSEAGTNFYDKIQCSTVLGRPWKKKDHSEDGWIFKIVQCRRMFSFIWSECFWSLVFASPPSNCPLPVFSQEFFGIQLILFLVIF